MSYVRKKVVILRQLSGEKPVLLAACPNSWRGLTFWRLGWWYWAASGYGERVFRAFIVLLGAWLIFALLYTQVGFARWEPRMVSESDAAIAKRDDVGAPLRPLPRSLSYSASVMILQKPEPRPARIAAQTLVRALTC